MKNLSSFGRKVWRRYLKPAQITPASRLRDWAWAFWITPPFVVLPLFLPLFEPSSIPSALADAWDLYLLFVALPYAAGALLWARSRKINGRS